VCVSRLRSGFATLSVCGVLHAGCAPKSLEQASPGALACANLDLLVINNTDKSVRIYHAMKLVDEVAPRATKTIVIRPSQEVRYRAVLVWPEGSSTSRVGGQAIDLPTSIFDNRQVLFVEGGRTRVGGQAIDPATKPTASEIVIRPGDHAGPICQRTVTFARSLK
jgi:hypothetical protein